MCICWHYIVSTCMWKHWCLQLGFMWGYMSLGNTGVQFPHELLSFSRKIWIKKQIVGTFFPFLFDNLSSYKIFNDRLLNSAPYYLYKIFGSVDMQQLIHQVCLMASSPIGCKEYCIGKKICVYTWRIVSCILKQYALSSKKL